MTKNKIYISKKWPADVTHEITGYEQPLFSILDRSAKSYPHQTCTIYQGAKRSYKQVLDSANRVANFLTSRGIRKGDRVAIFLPNLPHYPAVFFGILKIGAICVTCNPLYTAGELNFQLSDCGAKLVFCMDHPEFYPTTVEAIKGTQVENVVICGVKKYIPKIKGIFGDLMGKLPKAEHHEPEHLFFDNVIAAASPIPPAVNIDPDQDLAMIIYTGGTTGRPKGASLTHASILYLHGL